jgi:hypothetical protein
MQIRTIVTVAALGAIVSWGGLVLADESLGNGLVIREDGGIAYVSGGIGSGQQDTLDSVSGRFNLKLTMATKDGKYIGRADVRIVNQQGQSVLSTVSDGPLLLAKLPAGNYKVEATAEGQSLSQDVAVPAAGQKQMVLTWPQEADDDGTQTSGRL